MYNVEHSTEAEEDLADIWVYSLQEWGIDQADKYIDELLAGCAHLERNPKLGRSQDSLRAGYFSLRVRQHTAYYTISGATVRIVRILHERMIPEKHL